MRTVSVAAIVVCAMMAALSGPVLARIAHSLRIVPAEARSESAVGRLAPPLCLAAAVVIAGWLSPSWAVFVALVVGSGLLIVVAMVDIAEHRIPNRLTYPASAVCLALAGAAIGFSPAADRGWSGLVAAGVFVTVLLVTHLMRPDGMGLGDVKLAFPLGFAIGWAVADVALAPAAVGFALATASVFGLVFAVAGGFAPQTSTGPSADVSSSRQSVPFGPALALGGSLTIALALGLS